MPEIYFECPKCKQTLDAPKELAAQLIECPTCKETIEVPVCSQLKESAKLPEPLMQAPVARSLIECPCCQKPVSTKAIACPSCGHPLTSSRPNPQRSPKNKSNPSNQWTDGQTILLFVFIFAVIAILAIVISNGGLLRTFF